MKCACSGGVWSSILVVAGLGAVGFGGYNLITKGCPLGMCRSDKASTVVPVSSTSPPAACPLSEGLDHPACCPEKSEAEREACCGHAMPSTPAPLVATPSAPQ
ncbi:MAG: hypothetical protein HBSAPP03_10870 [Phycisphaerae bacterium]|nr:MAG: hypothetical protein HBSAPP03_10870 [Phycisphaerae bacterium]